MKIRVLSAADLQRALPMPEAIEAVKEAYLQLSTGQATVPLRTPLDIPRYEGLALFMPAYLASSDELGLKVVSVFPDNTSRGLPIIHALVALLDAATGRPQAVMDGTYLTALRTGAASGAATDLLACQDARVAAIFGAGVQGRTQLEAICHVRDIVEVRVYDSVPQKAEEYVAEMRERGDPIPKNITVARSPEEAAQGSDIICTATTSTTPVFADGDLKQGVHINGVGSYTPEMQEIDAETVQRAKVVVDSREACWAEAGDLIVPLEKGLIDREHIHAELGEIIAGAKPGRTTPHEITFFKSVGIAVQDVATASRALQAAERIGLGVEVEL
jgi:ornithine cyclodeaminase